MKRTFCTIVLVFSLLLSMGGLALAEEGARPCVYAQAQNYWARQCSPFTFNSMGCTQATYTDGDYGLYATGKACHPGP